MINFKSVSAGAIGFFLLSACASTPDPAEICSAEWIAPRAERAMSDFKKDSRPIIRKLGKSGEKLIDGDKLGPLQMFSLMNSISALRKKFKNGRAMEDMRTLANTCNDPELIKNAMTDFMREQGVSDNFISFLNNFEIYLEMLETGSMPKITNQKS